MSRRALGTPQDPGSWLRELEARKAALTAAKLAAAAPTVPQLHPNLAEIYRAKVQTLQDALSAAPSGGTAALQAARALIDRIELKPVASGSGLEIELIGELAAMLRLETRLPRLIALCSLVR